MVTVLIFYGWATGVGGRLQFTTPLFRHREQNFYDEQNFAQILSPRLAVGLWEVERPLNLFLGKNNLSDPGKWRRRFLIREMTFLYARRTKQFLSSLLKVILGQEFIKRSKYSKSTFKSLHGDHPTASATTDPPALELNKLIPPFIPQK